MLVSREIIIVGAGAAGLFCAAQLADQGHDVLLVDSGKRVGRKIIMSGGGRCNFTNLSLSSEAYSCENAHFCKSALARYTQWDFIALVESYNIPYHEKQAGQLFCDRSSKDIVEMLLTKCRNAGVSFQMETEIKSIEKRAVEGSFLLRTETSNLQAKTIIIATGGVSMPRLGVTPFGYHAAEYFNLPIVPCRAGLVPLTLHKELLETLQPLAGVAVLAAIKSEQGAFFRDALLFTHRGLSGPAILQISNHWRAGEWIELDLLPDSDLKGYLQQIRAEHPKQNVNNVLGRLLPKRLVEILFPEEELLNNTMGSLTIEQRDKIIHSLKKWKIFPNGTEGYRTAEITLGGVSTEAICSKTMEVKSVPNLYFIGEVLDVNGALGGYNFQWAWSSAWACAEAVNQKFFVS